MKNISKFLWTLLGIFVVLPSVALVVFVGAWLFVAFMPFVVVAGCLVVPGLFLIPGLWKGAVQYAQSKKPFLRRRNALLVDKDPSSLSEMESILEESNIDVKVVNEEKTAIEEIAKNTYDLVVLDINMSNLSGGRVLADADRSIPVIVYSNAFRSRLPTSRLRGFKVIRRISKRASRATLEAELRSAGVLSSSAA